VLLHPVLPLDAVGDLPLIAATSRWVAVHQVLLLATGGLALGLWGPALAVSSERRALALVAAVSAVTGQLLNGINIAFMLGAAPELARQFPADASLGPVYQAAHMAAVMTGRLGAVLVAGSAAVWGWPLAMEVGQTPMLQWVARLAAVAGILGVLFATPGHPLMLTSVGLMAAWGIGVGARLSRSRPGTPGLSIPPG